MKPALTSPRSMVLSWQIYELAEIASCMGRKSVTNYAVKAVNHVTRIKIVKHVHPLTLCVRARWIFRGFYFACVLDNLENTVECL